MVPRKAHKIGIVLNALRILLTLVLLLAGAGGVSAQDEASPLRIFGYFQTLFQRQAGNDMPNANSFSLQQLNLFLQKQLAPRWTAFINIEAINSYNSKKNYGSLKFEEAWVKYRASGKFSVKLGLQIPTFNNLNEIKNRTPLLPYAIRPHVYEASFEEFVSGDEYIPTRGFAQIYGFFPADRLKLDYALYLGNTPQIRSDPERGQTGVDSSTAFLTGGRVGLRYGTVKIGFSGSQETLDFQANVLELTDEPLASFEDIRRLRIGADLSFDFRSFYFESELIHVRYGERAADLDIDASFYYATLGYYATPRLFLYGSYWFNREDATVADYNIKVPNAGVSYHFHDSITFKAQVARARLKDAINANAAGLTPITARNHFNFYAAAVSVFF